MLTVEMNRKKTVMVMILVVISMMVASTYYAQAEAEHGNLKYLKRSKANQILSNCIPLKAAKAKPLTLPVGSMETAEELSLDELDDVDVNELVAEYEKLPEEEKANIPGVWVVWARGLSWKRDDIPELSAEVTEGTLVGVRMVVKAIWNTPNWTLYKVVKGVVGHDCTRYEVEGYALYNKETTRFHLSLRGDGISEFEAVGKVYSRIPTTDCVKPRRFLRIAMKGRMTAEGDEYVFSMRGFAHRPKMLRVRSETLQQQQKKTTAVDV
jgi:hypothetical protein